MIIMFHKNFMISFDCIKMFLGLRCIHSLFIFQNYFYLFTIDLQKIPFRNFPIH
jgi:hypothetical protein